MSRPRKPTAVLKLQGTYQPCRHADRADNMPQQGWPEKPAGLTPIQDRLWEEVTTYLPEQCLGAIDTTMLRDLVRLYGVYCNLMAAVEESPEDTKTLKSAMLVWDRFWRAAQDYGLTPVARTRLQMPGLKDRQNQALEALNKLIESRS